MSPEKEVNRNCVDMNNDVYIRFNGELDAKTTGI